MSTSTTPSASTPPTPLPQRRGPAPRVFTGPPQGQLDQLPPAAMKQALIDRLRQLPGVEPGPSRRALPGTLGMHLCHAHARGAARAFLIDREVAHVHPGADASLHLSLPEPLRGRAIAAGWALPHPLAGAPTVSPDTVMVYAPRDEQELETVTALAQAAWDNACGRT